jgi:hypothetical protein
LLSSGCVEYSPSMADEVNKQRDNDTLCDLVGDCNARSSDLSDFIIPDDVLWAFQNYNTDDTISFNDIHLHRKSSDKDRCNAYGNKLLNMCKNNNIYIANGRVW